MVGLWTPSASHVDGVSSCWVNLSFNEDTMEVVENLSYKNDCETDGVRKRGLAQSATR